MAQPVAISYARFSSERQSHGDSFRRQTEASEKYAAENDLYLDKTLSFQDLGVSAYDRSNINTGALGAFLKAVKEGRVPSGATLIVESLDRISRQEPLAALQIFIDILYAGLTIVTLTDRQVYSQESVRANSMQLLSSIIIMQRAHEESATKGMRVSAAWKQKRKLALEQRIIMTRKVPYWIDVAPDRKSATLNKRAPIVMRVIEMAEGGIGNNSIVRKLNDEGTASWSETGTWQTSYIQKMMTSPALYGGIKIGDEIAEGYYPPLIDKDRFNNLQFVRKSRATTRSNNRKGPAVTNLFSGLLKCGYCGSPMQVTGYKNNKTGYERKYVACHGARTNATKCRMNMWFIDELEPDLLFWLTQVDYSRLMNVKGKSNLDAEREQLISLNTQVEEADLRIERTIVAIEEGATSMVPRLQKHEVEKDRLEKLREAQQRKVDSMASQEGGGATRMRGLMLLYKEMARITDIDQLRMLREQVSAAIHATVERIVLFPKGRSLNGSKDDRYIEITFLNGATRVIEPSECTP